MSRRKVWVRRAGASPTLIQIKDDDLVDDVRDLIVRKYANSLGRQYDSPDVTLRITPRAQNLQGGDRSLAPDESIFHVIDEYFPGGQEMEEALLIEVPSKRTPRPSPSSITHRQHYHHDDPRPHEDSGGYFPPMPASPHGMHASQDSRHMQHQSYSSNYPHSMSIVETGQLPPLPSPRPRGVYRARNSRQQTTSPTIANPNAPNASARHHRRQESSNTAEFKQAILGGQLASSPLPTPPSELPPNAAVAMSSKASTPPVERVSSPRPRQYKKRKNPGSQSSKINGDTTGMHPAYPLLSPNYNVLGTAAIPPINILIVEDNIINLKLLEAFVKKLRVRWATAMNGRDAVAKWREGGFHLVLMDIQLPIMSGLDATKEIRRLERVNGIGAFAKIESDEQRGGSAVNGESSGGEAVKDREAADNDKLPVADLFKSPVIIVALTASSLQSDRHEALAAGCNDFLTKPVFFPWLERKIMEWGCMQALIDYNGWRQWKQYAEQEDEKRQNEETKLSPAEREQREKKEQRRRELLAKMGQK